jgi:hypothetical protein
MTLQYRYDGKRGKAAEGLEADKLKARRPSSALS